MDIDGLEPGKVIIGGVSHGIVGPGSGFLNGIGKAIGSAASSISSVGMSIGVNAAKVGAEVYKYAEVDQLINTALQNGGKAVGYGLKIGGLAVAVLTPSDAIKGGNRPASKWYELTTETNNPKPEEDETDNGRYLYRFDTRSPEDIVKAGGFIAKGSDGNLRRHVLGQSYRDGTSAFVSTSKTREGALSAKGKRQSGYLYKIKYQMHGRDVNAEIPDNPFKFQQEIAVKGMIPFKDVNFLNTKFIP